MAGTEMAYRPLPDYELRVAGVAYPDDNVRGAPDIVVDVLSPSNTASEICEHVAQVQPKGHLGGFAPWRETFFPGFVERSLTVPEECRSALA